MSPRRSREAGVSLVELMVALVLGMITVIVMLQVFAASEGNKRTTTGNDDAQNSGALALAALQRDLRQGGYGSGAIGIVGCSLALPGGRSLSALSPLTINHADIPDGDADTDTLLVVYGNAAGAPEGNRITAQPSSTVYAVATPTAFAVNDLVVAAPAVRPATCALRLEPVTAVTSPAPPQVTVGTGTAGVTNGRLFNLGRAPRVLAYAVRGGNLTMCDHMANDCTAAAGAANPAIWVPIAGNIVSLRAQYGRDSSGPPMDGVVDVFDQTTPASACAWTRVSAVRLALVARSGQFERDTVTAAAPTWAGSADAPIALTDLADWQNFRYRTYETLVPLRNMTWQGVQPGC